MRNSTKIITIVGARPQFIKAAVVSRAISGHNNQGGARIEEVIVHTGQHYDHNMSDVFFDEMRIPRPDYHLNVCDCSHGAMTGRMLEEVEKLILKEKPDVLLVYGDTNSTLAGALAAAKLHVPVAHVEAGLRSFNIKMPEEINRILTDRISTFLFCPTETAVKNLAEEGIGNGPVSAIVANVGDVMYDAALYYRKIALPTDSVMRLLEEIAGSFYLATVHRAENTDDATRLESILTAFHDISRSTPIVLPLHPRTRKLIGQYGLSINGISVIDPVGYFDMLFLLDRCKAVFTDSGGLQKEAYFFHKPCVTLRDETEWVELVEHGFNKLAGAGRDNILTAEKGLSDLQESYSAGLYGDGDAGGKIIEVLSLADTGVVARI